jgi:ATP-dependent Zn protease
MTLTTDNELERTAHHEAGHCVAFHALNLGVQEVTVVRNLERRTAGMAVPIVPFGTGEIALRHAAACLAGPLAVKRWRPELADWERGADDDFKNARDQIDASIGELENLSTHALRHAASFLRVRSQAEEIIVEYWPEVQAIARALLKEATLSGDQVVRIFRETANA